MHGYYSTCINILVIFSLSFSLLLSLSPHSPLPPIPLLLPQTSSPQTHLSLPSLSLSHSSLQNPTPKTLPRHPLEPSDQVFKPHDLVFAVVQVLLLLCLLVSFFIGCLWGYWFFVIFFVFRLDHASSRQAMGIRFSRRDWNSVRRMTRWVAIEFVWLPIILWLLPQPPISNIQLSISLYYFFLCSWVGGLMVGLDWIFYLNKCI